MSPQLGTVALAAAMAVGPRPWAAHAHATAWQPTESAPTVGPSRVGVLPVVVQGDLPPSAAEQMREIIVENLSADDVEVIDDGTIDAALAGNTCEDAECRAQLAQAVEADYLVATHVEGDEDEFSATVTLIEAETGQEVAPFTGECTICGFVEVRDLVRMRTLDARAEVKRRASVEVRTPDVEPAPQTPVDQPAPPRSKLVPAGWGLFGAGAAAVVGGVVLLGLHKRSAGCLDNPRGGDCIPLRYTTAAPGGGVLGVGVLAAAAGVVMVVLGRKAENKPRSQVSVGPRGVAWRLRF